MTKLFPSDPLFWALVNSERREVKRARESYGRAITFKDTFLRDRRLGLKFFAYGWLIEERKGYLNEINSN